MRVFSAPLAAVLLGVTLGNVPSTSFAASVSTLLEVPYLEAAIKRGDVPQIAKRVPKEVDVFDM